MNSLAIQDYSVNSYREFLRLKQSEKCPKCGSKLVTVWSALNDPTVLKCLNCEHTWDPGPVEEKA